jgi:hypothetical protein
VRSSSKLANSPFFKKGEEHYFDRTTSAEEQFVLQVNPSNQNNNYRK